MSRLLIAALLLSVLAPAARAVRPGPKARADARRFGLDRPAPVQRRAPSAESQRAFGAFNAAQGGRWSLRFNPRTGLPESLIGGHDAARPGRPDDAARAFLSAHRDVLGVDPSVLRAERVTSGEGHRHVLYRQSYRGLPVEFTAVKVHLDEKGSVLGVHSTFEPDLALPTSPSVDAGTAGRAAAADAGGGVVRGAPSLVVVPLESDGSAHLAWKMRVDGRGGSWRYYVDALSGRVIFRYDIDRYIGPCQSSGVVTGLVYDVDPSSTPGTANQGTVRPFNNQYVYVPDGAGGLARSLTGGDPTFGDGFFCSPVPGKVTMSLQGPYVSVAEFRGPSAHYDNGNGVWSTVATPVSSPHPYPNSTVSVSTIDLSVAAPNAVSFLPIFSSFHVGAFDGGSGEGSGDITDDDELFVYDGSDNPVAAYIGDRKPFNGVEVHGKKLHLALRANDSGQNTGYDVAVSSYLTLSNPTTDGAPLSSHTWTASDTSLNLRSEVNLFYHLNRMHDYFLSGVDKSSAAPITGPVVAMAHVGPNLLNAFYDPDYDALYFGDVSDLSPQDAFTADATVPHHEYVHYLVEKIWSIQNYGQAGTISEANADYFAASSLEDSSIGVYVLGAIGGTSNSGTGALRELDDLKSGAVFFNLNNPSASPWTGEIHDDSPFVSQALWDIRRASIARLGSHDAGKSCADGLVFQSLLFFPESFSELYEDLLQVDAAGAVAACGGANVSQSIIYNAFGAHGILPASGDAYENDDGFETAVDISTLGAVSATIFPTADTDFYSFGAGPGLVQATLDLPSVGGSFYKAYQLKLYDSSRRLVASAAPPYNAPGATLDGVCNQDDCQTTAARVVLSYNNPSGGLLYVQVLGGEAPSGTSVSGVNSTTPYTLRVAFPRAGALAGSVVSARFDRDVIGFAVHTATFVRTQDWSFASAQLRDQSHRAMANTLTHVPAQAGDFLTFVSSQSAYGEITGQVQLSTGFAARFPAAGSVYLEIFATDVHGETASMGESNAINLSAAQPELTAYNNLFNPLQGQKALVKYAVGGAGRLTVKLYTVTGRYIRTLYDGDVPAGKGTLEWDGRNVAGSVVASGVYVVRAAGPGLTATQKIAVVK